MPIAEKAWIESEGKLPKEYVSPLEKGEEFKVKNFYLQ